MGGLTCQRQWATVHCHSGHENRRCANVTDEHADHTWTWGHTHGRRGLVGDGQRRRADHPSVVYRAGQGDHD
jgi:hypothetical protein